MKKIEHLCLFLFFLIVSYGVVSNLNSPEHHYSSSIVAAIAD